MEHRYSTAFLLIIGVLLIAVYLISALSSEDIDTLCNVENSVLYRLGGEWICGNLTGNFNNINVAYTNQSNNFIKNNSFNTTTTRFYDILANNGINLLLNNEFNSNLNNWTQVIGSWSTSVDGDDYYATITAGVPPLPMLSQNFNCIVGRTYLVKIIYGYTASGGVTIYMGGNSLYLIPSTPKKTGTGYITCSSATTTFNISAGFPFESPRLYDVELSINPIAEFIDVNILNTFQVNDILSNSYVMKSNPNYKIIMSGDDLLFYINGIGSVLMGPTTFNIGLRTFINNKPLIVSGVNSNLSVQTLALINTTLINSDILTRKINTTQQINTNTNFSVNNVQGITKGMNIVKSVDLIGLTKVMCDLNFTGGILYSTTC